jgi:predicted transcriptional regulator
VAEAGDLKAYLAKRHGIRTRALPAPVMMGAIRRFDRHNQQLLLDDTLEATTARFQIAQQIAWQECRGELNTLVREAGLTTPTATNLLRRALAAYVAAAIIMPYDAFAGGGGARL